MICHTLDVPHANIAASPLNDHSSIQEQLDSIPIDAILPLIEEEWKDEGYDYEKLTTAYIERLLPTLPSYADNYIPAAIPGNINSLKKNLLK